MLSGILMDIHVMVCSLTAPSHHLTLWWLDVRESPRISEIKIKMKWFWLKKMRLKLSTEKWWPFCPGFIVLTETPSERDKVIRSCWYETCMTLQCYEGHMLLKRDSTVTCHSGRGQSVGNGACHSSAIAGAIILVPWHGVKSLQLIWRLGTRRWNLRVPNLQMSCRDLTSRSGARIVVPVIATRVTCPIK